jgi:mannose-6-phosphate isomerase
MAEVPPAVYPFRTEPVYRHYIWGGKRLAPLLGKPLGPQGTLAESWEIADEATVAEGPWQGRTLREVDEMTGGSVTGDAPHYANARLSLLVKLSDAAQDLSVQIHPSDEQALRDDAAKGYPGKTEMYYVIDAAPGAGVYWGLRDGVTAGQLERACRGGDGVVPALINFVPVKKGDVLFSPSRVVHAIGKGIVYCEVQQNSDITYRLYDWGRVDAEGKPRPLHLEQALKVLDTSKQRAEPIVPLALPATATGVRRIFLCACRYFAVELLEFPAEHIAPSAETVSQAAGDTVEHLATVGDVLAEVGIAARITLRRTRATMRGIVVLEGTVSIAGGSHIMQCGKGHSAVVPAALPVSAIGASAGARVLLAYEPDLVADVVDPLRAAGYSAEEVAALGDFT